MLIDKRSIGQVLGALANSPRILNDKKYSVKEEDFGKRIYKIIFSAISNLNAIGNFDKIDGITIDNYLSAYTEQYEIFTKNNGVPYINSLMKLAEQENNFPYYYDRVKRYSFINYLSTLGIINYDLFLGISGLEKNSKRQEEFDSLTLKDLTGRLDSLVTDIKITFEINNEYEINEAGNGIHELIKKYKLTPDIGLMLQGMMYNTAIRGARKRKLYMRSAASGVGKSRLMIGNACNLSMDSWYDHKTQTWMKNKNTVASGYITTELELNEVQAMMLGWVTGIDEDIIKDGTTNDFEDELLAIAADIIERSPIRIGYISNFDSDDIETMIRKLHHMKVGEKKENINYIDRKSVV